jgi:hypothetical protein
LREFANHIGLKPSFTILDRSDAADLMNLVRHELGQSKTKERFSKKGHLPRHLFARGQFPRCTKNDPDQAISVVHRLGR